MPPFGTRSGRVFEAKSGPASVLNPKFASFYRAFLSELRIRDTSASTIGNVAEVDRHHQ